MDRKTLLAIALSALVLIFVPMLLQRTGLLPKRPVSVPSDTPQPRPSETLPESDNTAELPVQQQVARPQSGLSAGASESLAVGTDGLAAGTFASLSAMAGRQIRVETDLYVATFNTQGAKLSGIRLKNFRDAADGSVELSGIPTAWLDFGDDGSLRYLEGAVYEAAESTDSSGHIRSLRFTALDSAGLQVIQTYSFSPDSYLIELAVQMDNVLERGFSDYHISLQSWPLITEKSTKDDLQSLQAVSRVGSDIKRDRHGDLLKKGARRHDGALGWLAVTSKYFAVAAVPVAASAKASFSSSLEFPASQSADGKQIPVAKVRAGLVMPVPPPGQTHRILLFAGPNDYWILRSAGHDLHDIVDLGWRWLMPFSRAILQVMVFLKDYIPNFGVVIILLSLLVKVVFHPLTAASMKSMQSMQKIQPEVEKVRKKYAKDSQKMNQAIMGLYKEHKVNPLGGCLPMLIQMPVLFALYQVFLHAIDLRQAPFFLWINDLASPDVLFDVSGFPIRILPVIMYGSAWVQQKLTPTDPRQRITMHLMNLFMLVLFYNLPSGLVLYWTVTNLLTAAQQYLVKRGHKPPQVQPA